MILEHFNLKSVSVFMTALLAHPVFGSCLRHWAWFVKSHLVNLIKDLTETIIPSQINSPLKEDLRLQMKLLNLVKLFVEPHL